MNALFIAWADSFNFWIPPLVSEFISHDCKVRILSTRDGDEHNRMFKNLENIRIVKSLEEAISDLGNLDIAVYGTLHDETLFARLEDKSVLCISIFDHLIPSEYVFGSGSLNSHLTFCFGRKFIKAQEEHGVRHSFMAVGTPQYDELTNYRKDEVKGRNNVLFLEQHFYPAGKEGKSQLAEMLIEAANSLPDYKITVKPRTVRSQLQVALHKAEHLFDYIESYEKGPIPSNLKLLEEHTSLNELTINSDIVATTFSAAIYPAMLLGKKVLFVKGFSSIETEYYKSNYISYYYKYLKETGRVIHYKNFKSELIKAKTVDNDELSLLYEITDKPVSEIIYEVTNFIVNNIYRKCKILPLMNLEYNSYKKVLEDYFKNNEQDIIEQKEVNLLNRKYTSSLELFFLFNLFSDFKFKDEFGLFKKELDTEFHKFRSSKDNDLNAFIPYIREFCENYLFNLTLNRINEFKNFSESFQSWIIKELYKRKSYNKMELLCQKVQHTKSSNYYMGMYAEEKGNFYDSVKYLEKFISIYNKENYKICHTSHEGYYNNAKRKVSKLSLLSFKLIYYQRKTERNDLSSLKLFIICMWDYIVNKLHHRSSR